MIKLILYNGEVAFWDRSQYDNYRYDGSVFAIEKNSHCVGLYNMKYVVEVVIEDHSVTLPQKHV